MRAFFPLSLITLFLIFPLFAQESEVSVPTDSLVIENGLIVGDLAPSWALMYAPGEFEFLKNWTVEKDDRLRKSTSQPDRHVVVLSFFATWCKPCMKELPHLENLFQKYTNEPVKFFLVDITEATRKNPGFEDSPKAGDFLRNKGITMPILFDNRGVAKDRYHVSTLPRLFIIDKYQTIQMTQKGFHEDEDFEGKLSEVIDGLLAQSDVE